jgi:uncharacterized membrane protein
VRERVPIRPWDSCQIPLSPRERGDEIGNIIRMNEARGMFHPGVTMTVLVANTSLALDPAWPWSLPGVGVLAFAGCAVFLALLTIWTYLGTRGSTWRRLSLVLILRLLALVVACLVILRPSLAFDEEQDTLPTRLLFLFDYSESMKITDGFNNLSRWDNLQQIMETNLIKNALRKMADARVEVTYYQGAEDLRPYDPKSQPTGKATDMGSWFHEIRQRHGKETNVKGLILLSDGRDNGTKFPAFEEAAQFRTLCPIYSFGLGKPTTTFHQNDIELTKIRVEPDPIPAKSKMTVRASVNAPGFENSRVKITLWIQEMSAKEPKLVSTFEQVLTKTNDNEVVVTADAPANAGDIKVTLKIQPLAGEVLVINNDISTFATVTKEGVSILWVEGRKRLESTYAIRYGLGGDPRFRVFYTERLGNTNSGEAGADWFKFGERSYDVIVIGDIGAAQFAGGDDKVFGKIRDLISNDGTGLLMMGGYRTLSADDSDWNDIRATSLTNLLPILIQKGLGQIDGKVRMKYTTPGLDYLLRLDDNQNDKIWKETFDPLEGANNLGKPKKDSTLFAQGFAQGDENGEPLLVGTVSGKGRILVFAGDTTYRVWRRTAQAQAAYARFWKQLMLFLAHQENMGSNVQVILDQRRLPADQSQKLTFTLKARDKNGLPVKDPQLTVKIKGPAGDESDVQVSREGDEYHGTFHNINAPGDYQVKAQVKGKDAKGNALADASSAVHFLGYAQDRELLDPRANHEFLLTIAKNSGGRFALADERQLAGLLEELLRQRDQRPHARVDLWPDWRRHPASPATGDQLAALWQSTALPCFVVFVALLCMEWYLRRRWGMV